MGKMGRVIYESAHPNIWNFVGGSDTYDGFGGSVGNLRQGLKHPWFTTTKSEISAITNSPSMIASVYSRGSSVHDKLPDSRASWERKGKEWKVKGKETSRVAEPALIRLGGLAREVFVVLPPDLFSTKLKTNRVVELGAIFRGFPLPPPIG